VRAARDQPFVRSVPYLSTGSHSPFAAGEGGADDAKKGAPDDARVQDGMRFEAIDVRTVVQESETRRSEIERLQVDLCSPRLYRGA
jgi:hypothetical protein